MRSKIRATRFVYFVIGGVVQIILASIGDIIVTFLIGVFVFFVSALVLDFFYGEDYG